MQPPVAATSEAKLLKMLQQRRAAKSQATTPSNLSTSSRDSLTFSTCSKRYRINTSLPRLPHFMGSADMPTGVSAAFLVSSLVHCRSKLEQPTTRAAASVLRENGAVPIATLCGRVPHRERHENHRNPMDPLPVVPDVPVVPGVPVTPMDPVPATPLDPGDVDNRHPLTGGLIRGPSRVHVCHAWDASFAALVDLLVGEAGAELDRTYHLDIFEEATAGERSERSETGWCFGTCFLFFHILRISSSQLTNS